MKLPSKVVATLAVLAISSSAYALPIITGGLSLSGGYTVNTGDLNTATAFTSFSSVESSGGTGTFAPVVNNTLVTLNTFSWSPFPAGGVNPLWTVTVAGNTYSFNLASPISVTQGGNALMLQGTGTLLATGFANTQGTWLFTANQGGNPATFSFSSSNGANVPDGGASIALLGLSILGLGGVSRFVRRK